jgi:hypothetical protein
MPETTIQEKTYEIDLTDMIDDEQAMTSAKESVMEDFVYKVQGKLRLTKKGVDWASRQYAKKGEIIKIIDHPKVVVDPEDKEYVLITILALRSALVEGKDIPLDTHIGAKRQWRKMKLSDTNEGKAGEIVPNPHWFEHGVSKAQRNAKLGLMESDFIAQIVAAWLEKKTGKPVHDNVSKSAQQKTAPSQPPAQGTKEKTPVELAKEAAAKTKADAENKAKEQKPAEASTPATRQRLFGLLAVIGYEKDEEKKRVFARFIPGYESSKQVPEQILVDLNDALKRVKDKVWHLKHNAEGLEEIVDGSGAAKYPLAAPTTAAKKDPF